MLSRLFQRIGRRGAFLTFLGFVDLVYAWSLINPAAAARGSSTLRYLAHIAPLSAWGGLWATVGVVCLVGAFARRDRWAFAAAVLLKVLAGVTLLTAWLFGGVDRGYVSAAIWLGFAALTFLISSWPEPTPRDLEVRP